MPRQEVAIILCTYNGEMFLREQLNSILNQTRTPDKIIIRDDQSTDDTVSIVNSFRESNPSLFRFEVNESRLGFIENFWRCISDASDYNMHILSDQDDVWHPTKIETMVEALSRDHQTLVIHQANLIDSVGKTLKGNLAPHSKFGKLLLQDVRWNTCFQGMRMGYRNFPGLLDLMNDFRHLPSVFETNSCIAHDELIQFLFMISGNVLALEDRLVSYRLHSNSTSNNLEGQKDLNLTHLLSPGDPFNRQRQIVQARIKALSETRHFLKHAEFAKGYFKRLRKMIVLRKICRKRLYSKRTRSAAFIKLAVLGAYSKPLGPYGGRQLIRDILSLFIS